MNKLLITALFLCFATFGFAQDLVYKAKNPNFGGDTFNYQVLLSGAQAQNPYSSSSSFSSNNSTALEDFQSSLDRQVLSTLSRQIVNNQFGESALKPGSYAFGNFTVDVSNTLTGILVDVLDTSTGETTQVLIPFF